MKKILLFILLLPLFTAAQVNIHVSTGFNFKENCPLVALGFGGSIGHFEPVLDIRINPTRVAGRANYLGAKIGYKVYETTTFSIGRYLNYKKGDNFADNKWYMLYSLQYQNYFTEKTNWFVEGTYVNRSPQLNLGFKYILD